MKERIEKTRKKKSYETDVGKPKLAPSAPPTKILSVEDIVALPELDIKKQIKRFINPEIPPGLVDQLMELQLIPTDPTTGEFSIELLNSLDNLRKYLPDQKTIDFCQFDVMPIYRAKGDIKTIEILNNSERTVVEYLADQLEDEPGLEIFMRCCQEKIDDAVYEVRGKLQWRLKGLVAWYYFNSLKTPKVDDSMLNLPLSKNYVLKTCECVHPPDTYEALLWDYIDLTYGLLIPSERMFEKKWRYLTKLNLCPRDWHTAYMLRDHQAYFESAQRLIDRGVPPRVFNAVLRYYVKEMSKEWKVKQEKLNLHFFIIAFLLNKDHPSLFKSYQIKVRNFIYRELEPSSTVEKLQKDLAELDNKKKIVRSDFCHPNSSEDEKDYESILEKKIKDKELRIQELKLQKSVNSYHFQKLLSQDLFLASVFYSYLFNGEKNLRDILPRGRPSKKVEGKIILYLTKKLKERDIKKRDSKIGWLLYYLTGRKEYLYEPRESPLPGLVAKAKKPIKHLRHAYKRRST
ncbi:MAG: hypothetical protein MUP17_12925 [candidate division Zixibacteria bacterium]|nr:hypothetical protein [candidate division Zixibacteria bacterium]